jgi:glycosyltransferase involved in cell wall biosynthesis
LVIDDGSPDDLRSALGRYGDRVVLVRKTNGGAASARNYGIDHARGDWIAFLDADDYWHPRKLERQAEVCRRYPEVALIAGWFDQEEPGISRASAPLDRRYFDRLLHADGDYAFAVTTQIWTGTVLVKRATLGEHRFVPGLEPAEDRDLWVRIVAAAPTFLMSEPLATAVLEPGSLSRASIDVDCQSMLRVIERHRGVLSRRGVRYWRAFTYRRWAAINLANRRPKAAFRRALQRFRLQPWSYEAWWVLAKCTAKIMSGAENEPQASKPKLMQ